MSSFVLLLALAQGTAAAPIVVEDGPHKMNAREIRAYNASLPRDHPSYIRCKVEGETGSLVRARSACRTNEEWRRVEDIGNKDARDIVDTVNSAGSSRDP